ncbi:hypothetical protein [Actinokineospora terrae]|uniref:DUF5753 domain-containing protein n=1 Tax=Actinokineospora terrae TaxID=155974 RepID=A0A1H9XT79_9PSEU|nr:hypothetical protein [Actinokineospora terrae]SES49344.1 hypothetical protein SAMN04487818_1276 [Actinokineospora terrae]
MERTVATQVARLRELGFGSLPIPLPCSRLGGIQLYRFTSDNHIDTVVVSVESFTVASRMENRLASSDPLAENYAVWSRCGDVETVVDALLDRFYPSE